MILYSKHRGGFILFPPHAPKGGAVSRARHDLSTCNSIASHMYSTLSLT